MKRSWLHNDFLFNLKCKTCIPLRFIMRIGFCSVVLNGVLLKPYESTNPLQGGTLFRFFGYMSFCFHDEEAKRCHRLCGSWSVFGERPYSGKKIETYQADCRRGGKIYVIFMTDLWHCLNILI